MIGLLVILIFVVLLALPGFYWITRSMFPKKSKRSVMNLSIGLTALLVGVLVLISLGYLPS